MREGVVVVGGRAIYLMLRRLCCWLRVGCRAGGLGKSGSARCQEQTRSKKTSLHEVPMVESKPFVLLDARRPDTGVSHCTRLAARSAEKRPSRSSDGNLPPRTRLVQKNRDSQHLYAFSPRTFGLRVKKSIGFSAG